jgi:hypothetical protein
MGVAVAARLQSEVVKAAEDPVKISPLLVFDLGLLRALGGEALTAGRVRLAPPSAFGTAVGVVLGIRGRLLGHALGADLLPVGTAGKAGPKR